MFFTILSHSFRLSISIFSTFWKEYQIHIVYQYGMKHYFTHYICIAHCVLWIVIHVRVYQCIDLFLFYTFELWAACCLKMFTVVYISPKAHSTFIVVSMCPFLTKHTCNCGFPIIWMASSSNILHVYNEAMLTPRQYVHVGDYEDDNCPSLTIRWTTFKE